MLLIMDITAVIPFDFVGSVMVPVAAILVSSGIAIGLASLERRAANRERLRR